ncbi:rhomboid family intramembrane serine protease [Kitasatospora atroaurantiaca]|uniref:Membrane associated rhomboid family serine protease n=1 Tax=Kitasatospora atroaurantiaca TaxID=285545 RepID=A0A561ESN8_9ACTN|nr:rhomboid family intramembrane serine protease [Kitasatospora atroaurantiaca]TWE18628.1 membrane associated rhomboid family serine protease [Kitasatospora atroaurantiaca]TWE18649.1 membrane associated rhomboid family serine protease [Kitasatospora atroaurantiaca]
MLPDEPARSQPDGGNGGHGGLPGCYRHPERETGIACARCGRPICPECMVNASVGFHCPECVRGGNQEVRRATTRFGGQPAGDDALVTKILIGINLVVFVLTQYVHPEWRLLLGMYSFTGNASYAPAGVATGPDEWYRLVTAVFVHNGPLHVIMNMISLWVLGPQLERVLGRLRFVALYAVSGLAGNALAYLVTGGNLYSVGASGAIFGLLGATAVLFRANRLPLGPVVALLVFNLVISFSVPLIDWRAHVGGLVAGAVTGVGMMYAPRAHRNVVQTLTVAGMLVLVLVIVAVETARLGV